MSVPRDPGASPRVVIVGAGLAGLIAGLDAADRGAAVTVLDGAGHAGGRAHTTVEDGFHRNLGPHAVYRRGELAAQLGRLGVPVPGRIPSLTQARFRSREGMLPRRAAGRLALALPRVLARPPQAGASVATWLDAAPLDDRQRSLVRALVRTATYAEAPTLQDAAAAHTQLRLATGGVRYVHGGWGALVASLVAAVERHGGEVRRSAPVRRVVHDTRARGVVLADGQELPADAVVVAAGGPREAARLLDSSTAGGGEVAAALAAREDVPVRMATLDVTLDELPGRWPAQVFGDGDDPRYWLAQSRFVRLAPGHGEVVHVARYLGPDETADDSTRADLEALFDDLQPGWRRRVRHARFLPGLTVTHALPRAAAGGLAGRVPVRTGVPGLALAGDWVGPVGQLADACAASAVEASRAVLADQAPAEAGAAPQAVARSPR